MSEEKSCNCISRVECDAKKCLYNDECHCTASNIHVGDQSACTSDETRCSTFIEK